MLFSVFSRLPDVLGIRGNYEATDSSCLEKFHAAETTRGASGVVREDISGYGDFYVPILIHAGTTRRMARYFLRATAFRASAEIYESCRPSLLSLSLSIPLS